MKDKATFQNKVKVLNKLFDSGCDTEKKLQQLDMEAILKIPNITIPDMGVIMELQKNTKSGKLFALKLYLGSTLLESVRVVVYLLPFHSSSIVFAEPDDLLQKLGMVAWFCTLCTILL